MNFDIIASDEFNKQVKKLAKKHSSLKSDLVLLQEALQENPTMGAMIGANIFKIRMAITSKGKGKSGGARVITYVLSKETTIYLLTIYDKSEQENISDNDILDILEHENL